MFFNTVVLSHTHPDRITGQCTKVIPASKPNERKMKQIQQLQYDLQKNTYICRSIHTPA